MLPLNSDGSLKCIPISSTELADATSYVSGIAIRDDSVVVRPVLSVPSSAVYLASKACSPDGALYITEQDPQVWNAGVPMRHDGAVCVERDVAGEWFAPVVGEVSLNGKIVADIPSLYFDFTLGTLDALIGPATITFTRATSATYFDANGVLQTAASGVPVFDYDPVTLAPRGLAVWSQRTNSIRNNTMQGAAAGVIGSGGSLPTNWFFGVATSTGLTREVVATGTEDGIEYVDLRLHGTVSGDGSVTILFEAQSQIVASPGQVWTGSVYTRLVGGSWANVGNTANTPFVNSYAAAGTFVAISTNQIPNRATPTNAPLKTQRQILTGTLSDASTERAGMGLFYSLTDGTEVDFTLRIGLPQLELGAFATPVIKTTGSAATRNADAAVISTLTPWFNATEGTIVAEALYPSAAASGQNSGIVEFDDGDFNEAIALYVSAAGVRQFTVRNGGVSQFAGSVSGGAANTLQKLALAYKANDFAGSANGSAVTTATSGTVPTVTRMALGDVAVGQKLNGWIRSIAYYPRRLPNGTLQALSQ